MEVKISDWAWVPVDQVASERIVRLEKKLTVMPRRTSIHQKEIKPIKLFRRREGLIGVPRQHFLQTRKLDHQIIDEMSRGRKIDLAFAGEAMHDQQAAVDAILDNHRLGSPGSIIQAKPGWGKTVVALQAWLKFGCTAVVIVHKKFLLDQWKERIEQFVPGARVGIIQQKKCQFGDDFDISIAMIQSLNKNKDKYPAELWSWAGLVVPDEVHRVGAATWSGCVPLFNAHYRLGLTATPRRKDGTERVFFSHIGEIIYQSKAKLVMPKLRRVFTGFEFHVTPESNPNDFSREIQLRFLCANRKRNMLIVRELHSAIKAGRKVMILSGRLKHLDNLKKMFDHNKHENCVSDYYVGGRTPAELKKAEGADVLFCTYKMAEEALDIPSLDTVFLVTPMSDVEQSVGRIMREHDEKRDPVIVDFIDDLVSIFEKAWLRRLKFYIQEGMFKENAA